MSEINYINKSRKYRVNLSYIGSGGARGQTRHLPRAPLSNLWGATPLKATYEPLKLKTILQYYKSYHNFYESNTYYFYGEQENI